MLFTNKLPSLTTCAHSKLKMTIARLWRRRPLLKKVQCGHRKGSSAPPLSPPKPTSRTSTRESTTLNSTLSPSENLGLARWKPPIRESMRGKAQDCSASSSRCRRVSLRRTSYRQSCKTRRLILRIINIKPTAPEYLNSIALSWNSLRILKIKRLSW